MGRLGAGALGAVFLGRGTDHSLAAVTAVHPHHAVHDAIRTHLTGAAERLLGRPFPWTVTLLDADASGPVPWLASQYVAAPSLPAMIDHAGTLPDRATGRLGRRLSEALAALHADGVNHHALRPSAVLLATDGPRITGAGVDSAALLTTHTTVGQGPPASPCFLAPEQALGEPAGPAADVFALASVLVAACTGVGPFGDGAPLAVLRRLVGEHPDLRAVPRELAQALQPCLVRAPCARPTAAELHALLEPWDGLWMAHGVPDPPSLLR